jgi:hypothetical protein
MTEPFEAGSQGPASSVKAGHVINLLAGIMEIVAPQVGAGRRMEISKGRLTRHELEVHQPTGRIIDEHEQRAFRANRSITRRSKSSLSAPRPLHPPGPPWLPRSIPLNIL